MSPDLSLAPTRNEVAATPMTDWDETIVPCFIFSREPVVRIELLRAWLDAAPGIFGVFRTIAPLRCPQK